MMYMISPGDAMPIPLTSLEKIRPMQSSRGIDTNHIIVIAST